MMNAEIITVGSELLLGQILNTNAKFISSHLARLGVNVYYQTVVGDNPERLKNALQIAQNRSDLIIFSGGLGPTKDDLTKETLAQVLDVHLVYDEKALSSIQSFFKKRKVKITENNKKQALVFENAQVLPNETGLAPGMALTKDGLTYILLPGPPSELEPMFVKYAIPVILKQVKRIEKIESRMLRFFGIGESNLEQQLEDLIDNQSNPTIAPLASDGEVSIRLTAKHADDQIRKQMLDEVEREIQSRVGQYFYGYDETTIIKEMANLIEEQNYTLAAAESLTGGLFQEEVTSISGVSKWFKGGIVSYSTEVKMNTLGVKIETIDTYGVVSAECAKEMAENVRKLMDADIGISFTGVAGPASLEGKEPGTVYIGVSLKNSPAVAHLKVFPGNRERVRVLAVKTGAWHIIKEIKNRLK